MSSSLGCMSHYNAADFPGDLMLKKTSDRGNSRRATPLAPWDPERTTAPPRPPIGNRYAYATSGKPIRWHH